MALLLLHHNSVTAAFRQKSVDAYQHSLGVSTLNHNSHLLAGQQWWPVTTTRLLRAGYLLPPVPYPTGSALCAVFFPFSKSFKMFYTQDYSFIRQQSHKTYIIKTSTKPCTMKCYRFRRCQGVCVWGGGGVDLL